MTMTPPLRKLMLTVHVTASVGWAGALAVFLALAVASLVSRDEPTVRAMSLALGITAWFVILPLSIISLTTGLVQAMGTSWGLFRDYWILFKLLLTTVATAVLLLKLQPISYLAARATESAFSPAELVGLRTSLTAHAAGGLGILLVVAVLAIYKPVGVTPYGIRKRHEESGARSESGLASTPRWVKVFGFAITMLFVSVVVMLLVGRHGPGAHMVTG